MTLVQRIAVPLPFLSFRVLPTHHLLRNFSISSSNHNKEAMIKAPAAERNKQPILDVLSLLFPKDASGDVLEIASGTGQHVIHFASYFENMSFYPTEYDASSIESLNHNVSFAGLKNVKSPVQVDITQPLPMWNRSITCRKYDLMTCINMIHITPWQCTEGLFNAASQLLKPQGLLLTYGPYAVNAVLEPESNRSFDRHLRLQDPSWGVRDIRDIKQLAETVELELLQTHDLPANNKALIFRKR